MYYDRCRALLPQIAAIAAKWTFEDLIPGLSDFDVRLIFSDPMDVRQWIIASEAVGRVHTEMCREFPEWARNLEHLPGVNLTVDEIRNPLFFYPEFQQWTFYDGKPEIIAKIQGALRQISWSSRDELYHLKKFAAFCGPYNREIDQPINLGRFEGKYPLHSRYMHYFAPPVQAVMSLLHRRNIPGKLEALRMARLQLPNPHVIDCLFETLERHYEVPQDYQEPRLSQLERELEAYLQDAWAALEGHVTLVKHDAGNGCGEIRKKVTAVKGEPIPAFFECAKFGRLLKGRLQFYAQTIPHFDSAWLIRNELGRAAANFYHKPLSIYGQVRYGGQWSAAQVLERLRGKTLTDMECRDVMAFAHLAAQPIPVGEERKRSQQAADGYDSVLTCLEKLGQDLLQCLSPENVGRNTGFS
jgi:hypothetical protein